VHLGSGGAVPGGKRPPLRCGMHEEVTGMEEHIPSSLTGKNHSGRRRPSGHQKNADPAILQIPLSCVLTRWPNSSQVFMDEVFFRSFTLMQAKKKKRRTAHGNWALAYGPDVLKQNKTVLLGG